MKFENTASGSARPVSPRPPPAGQRGLTLGGGGAGGHHGGAGDAVADAVALAQNVERGDEVLVAHDVEPVEHVQHRHRVRRQHRVLVRPLRHLCGGLRGGGVGGVAARAVSAQQPSRSGRPAPALRSRRTPSLPRRSSAGERVKAAGTSSREAVLAGRPPPPGGGGLGEQVAWRWPTSSTLAAPKAARAQAGGCGGGGGTHEGKGAARAHARLGGGGARTGPLPAGPEPPGRAQGAASLSEAREAGALAGWRRTRHKVLTRRSEEYEECQEVRAHTAFTLGFHRPSEGSEAGREEALCPAALSAGLTLPAASTSGRDGGEAVPAFRFRRPDPPETKKKRRETRRRSPRESGVQTELCTGHNSPC